MAAAERTELDLWPYEEARRLAERVCNYPPERAVIFESGFGPSGLPHLGTMGEVLRPAYVQHAFQVLGKVLDEVPGEVPVETERGLLVPVLHHAEAFDLWQAAAEIARLADVARAGKATREELTGSTITLTSLGALGGLAATPVINYPEVAIIGVNRNTERPVVRDGQIVIRKMMNLSSSFDHRIVDGWEAAEFIQRVKRDLEQPALLFLG